MIFVTLAPGHDVPTLRLSGTASELRDLFDWTARWTDSALADDSVLVWDSRPVGTSTLAELVEDLRAAAWAGRVELEVSAELTGKAA